MAFRFKGCLNNRLMISLLVGSDMARKTSLLFVIANLCNHPVTNVCVTVQLRKSYFEIKRKKININ